MGGELFLGVDVGTGSARAGVFTEFGELLSVATKEIKINNPQPGFYEQSSEDIWNSVKHVIKESTKPVSDKSRIVGLSFCATCSLVAVSSNGAPVSVNTEGDTKWDVVMWMDHRASKEAFEINNGQHQVLTYVGGKISLEMQTPKLLWLKRNLFEQCYQKTKEFYDLPDFLRWKATGKQKRSLCSVVCKWTHLNDKQTGNKWDSKYFEDIGLSDVVEKIGDKFSFPGDNDKISPKLAQELGLNANVLVGYSMIDAHSGVLGMLGAKADQFEKVDVSKRLALICGTSNCHMALNDKECLVPGVWGPYFGVIIKNLYLSEGGQSAAGKLLDHVVTSHAAYNDMLKQFKSHGEVLSELERILIEKPGNVTKLTEDLHVWPDFHGNRSPVADSTLKGMISGLTLDQSKDNLAILYLATIQALAYGSLHIKETMEGSGHSFTELVICGGLTKSNLFVQIHSDVLQLPVLIPDCPEPVLLGAAMSSKAAVAQSLLKVVENMAGNAKKISPKREDKLFHERKYKVFKEMLKDQLKYRTIMKQ